MVLLTVFDKIIDEIKALVIHYKKLVFAHLIIR